MGGDENPWRVEGGQEAILGEGVGNSFVEVREQGGEGEQLAREEDQKSLLLWGVGEGEGQRFPRGGGRWWKALLGVGERIQWGGKRG